MKFAFPYDVRSSNAGEAQQNLLRLYSPMNRLLPISALLLSLCAVLATLLLWQEVRALRLEASQHPLQAQLSDEQFSVVKNFVDYMHTLFDKGNVPKVDVLVADQLLNRARYMHGDISQAEWHRLRLAAEPELTNLHILKLKVGAGSIQEVVLSYDDLLESSR